MAKKIYVVHVDLLYDTNKRFQELTDEDLVQLCEKDTEHEYHDVYDSIEEISDYWNSEEFYYPSSSYMRVLDDGKTPEPDVEELAAIYNGLTCAQKDEFLRLTDNQ